MSEHSRPISKIVDSLETKVILANDIGVRRTSYTGLSLQSGFFTAELGYIVNPCRLNLPACVLAASQDIKNGGY